MQSKGRRSQLAAQAWGRVAAGGTHVQLLLRLRKAVAIERIDQKYDAVHRGEVLLPQPPRCASDKGAQHGSNASGG